MASFLGAFSYKVDTLSAIDVEIFAVIEAVCVAQLKGWVYL